jgi:hypothetical protein
LAPDAVVTSVQLPGTVTESRLVSSTMKRVPPDVDEAVPVDVAGATVDVVVEVVDVVIEVDEAVVD